MRREGRRCALTQAVELHLLIAYQHAGVVSWTPAQPGTQTCSTAPHQPAACPPPPEAGHAVGHEAAHVGVVQGHLQSLVVVLVVHVVAAT